MGKSLAQLKADAKAEGWADWIRSTADEHALLAGCWFDIEAGKHWCDFIERWFRFTRAPRNGRVGDPYKLLDWHRNDFLMPLFGWKRNRQQKHLRRYLKGDVFIGKKQAKSTIAGALCDAFLVKGPARTEVYGVAHSTEQASIIYREAAAFARLSPELNKRLKPRDSQKRIIYEEQGSFYQAMAGENGARSAEGIIPSLILFDEIHVQRDRMLYDALAYACLAAENSLFLSVSTVGVADKTTIWWEQYEYAKGIMNSQEPYCTDWARFAFVAQADEGCKDSAEMRADPNQWAKAMPALGVTVTESRLEADVREAENSPAKLNNLLRYVFNIPTAQIERVIPMEQWQSCEYVGADWPDLAGRECVIGLDVASHEDLTALVLYFPPIDGEPRGWVQSYFWCPEDKVRDREIKQIAHYRAWVDAGHIYVTAGARIDQEAIVDKARELLSEYRAPELLYDKWGAEGIIAALQFDTECIQVEQGPSGMAGFCRLFLDAVTDEKIWHDGNPVMTWCCANTAAESRPDVVWFSKKKSTEKIDGAIAGAMAVGRGMTKGDSAEPELLVL